MTREQLLEAQNANARLEYANIALKMLYADQELILRQANAYNTNGDLLAVFQTKSNNKHP